MLKAQFDAACAHIDCLMLKAPKIPAKSWQSVKAPQAMPEIFNFSLGLDLEGHISIENLQKAIKPNLPWAERHFLEERVSRHPKNPGETYKIWQDGKSAENHLRDGEQFDHSYAERYWPMYAGKSEGGILPDDRKGLKPNVGYRFWYGDLDDLVDVLLDDPLTRQAYLPIWFPEDLGAIVSAKARVPCTLGYHFIRRDDKLHVIYPMRSCDYVRHFRDDVYLTIRLLQWVLDELKRKDDLGGPDGWQDVTLGTFTMHITSLHCFESDLYSIENRVKYGAK
jgi:hypothetical protein